MLLADLLVSMRSVQMGQDVSRYGDRSLVSAWVDQERREELVALARRQDRSVSSIVRRAIDRELQRTAKVEGAARRTLSVRGRNPTSQEGFTNRLAKGSSHSPRTAPRSWGSR